jgi:hypothetical protein
MKSELVYLACPYSSKEPHMLAVRWAVANRVAAKLMAEGNYIFSPISHTHPIKEVSNGTLPGGWEYWEGFDRQFLSFCKKIIVIRIPGWKESTGVQAEIKIGYEFGIPIEYIDYDLSPTYDELVKVEQGLDLMQGK